jgi:hypothetical protein
MPLHRTLRKEDRQLCVDDIDGAKLAPPPETRFIRDTIDISDIEGTSCRSRYASKVSQRRRIRVLTCHEVQHPYGRAVDSARPAPGEGDNDLR